MPSVSIIYRKDKENKKGESPVHLRIIKDRKISYISTGILLPEDMWDSKNNKVKSKHKNSARFNSFITNKFAELQDQVFEHETVSKSTTTRQLRDKVYGKKALLFFPFADESVETYKSEGKISTHVTVKGTIQTFKDYFRQEL